MSDRLFRLGLAVVLIGSVAACKKLMPSGTTAYQAGYTDGCVSGFGDAGKPGFESVYQRDTKRFAGDPEYRRGWTEGEKSCYAAETKFPTMGGTADRGVGRNP